jgi:hypothetical protein
MSAVMIAACSIDDGGGDTASAPSSSSPDGGTSGGDGSTSGPATPGDDAGAPQGNDGGDDSGSPQPDGGDDSGSPQVTTVHVTAAAGGTVADPSGNTTLVIPPGALAADVDITLTVLPKSGAAVVDVSEFGPDGLQFSVPVTLTIKADASLAPKDKTLAVALHDGTDFKAIAGSTFSSGAASAQITHFSKYSVVVIDGQVVIQPPESCAEAKSTFAACGGDIKGTWVFKQFCVDLAPIGNSNCPTMTGSTDFDMNEREIVFGDTTFTAPAGTMTISSTINYPRSCIDNATCAQLEQSIGGTCTENPADVCRCTTQSQEPLEAKTNTYTVNGNTIVSDGDTMEYCVKGDLLSVKTLPTDPKETPAIWILQRK